MASRLFQFFHTKSSLNFPLNPSSNFNAPNNDKTKLQQKSEKFRPKYQPFLLILGLHFLTFSKRKIRTTSKSQIPRNSRIVSNKFKSILEVHFETKYEVSLAKFHEAQKKKFRMYNYVHRATFSYLALLVITLGRNKVCNYQFVSTTEETLIWEINSIFFLILC